MRHTAFELDRSARWTSGGRALLAGEPLRLFRFSERGASGVRLLAAGANLDEASRQTGADLGRLVRRLLDAGALHPRPAGGSYTAADTTVVIPVLDRAGALGPLLDRLAGTAAEVRVVDDGSTDGSGEVARRHGARVVRRLRPAGPAAARNLGWRLPPVTEKVVAFLDSDCSPEPDWLDRLLPHFADPEVGAVAPRLVGSAGDDPGLAPRYDAAWSALDLGARPAAVRPGTRVSYVPAAALVVRREALEAVGGFDEHLPTGEDVDFVWRLLDAGWSVRYDPSVVVAHASRTTLWALAGRRFAYGSSAGALARRHPGRLAAVRVPAWSLLAWAPCVAPRLRPRMRLACSTAMLLLAAGTLHRRLAGSERATPRQTTSPPDSRARTARSGVQNAPGKKTAKGPAGPGTERRVSVHPGVVAGLVGRAHLAALRSVRDGMLRPYGPVSLLLVGSRRARPFVLGAIAARGASGWWSRRSAMGPVAFTALQVGDDFAYSLGVWWGCLVHRTLAPLVPEVSLSGWARP